jgi:hypothetical protein
VKDGTPLAGTDEKHRCCCTVEIDAEKIAFDNFWERIPTSTTGDLVLCCTSSSPNYDNYSPSDPLDGFFVAWYFSHLLSSISELSLKS